MQPNVVRRVIDNTLIIFVLHILSVPVLVFCPWPDTPEIMLRHRTHGSACKRATSRTADKSHRGEHGLLAKCQQFDECVRISMWMDGWLYFATISLPHSRLSASGRRSFSFPPAPHSGGRPSCTVVSPSLVPPPVHLLTVRLERTATNCRNTDEPAAIVTTVLSERRTPVGAKDTLLRAGVYLFHVARTACRNGEGHQQSSREGPGQRRHLESNG